MIARTLFVAAALSLAGTSLATTLPPFEKVDVDRDGKISQSEAATVRDLNFASADTNKDGMLDQGEYKQAASKA
jgi:hypothetical protein